MRSVRLRAACAWMTSLLVAAGCVSYITVDEGEATTALFSVVVAGADSVFVALGKSGPGLVTAPETGAQLALTTSAGTVVLAEAPGVDCGAVPSYTCYSAALHGAVPPGAPVRLSGTLASGVMVSGSARTPDTPELTVGGKAPGDTVRTTDFARNPPPLEAGDGAVRLVLASSALEASVWTSEGDRRCSIRVEFPPAGGDVRALWESPSLVVDQPRCDGAPLSAWDSASATVTFLAYDENAAGWYFTRGGVPRDEAAWGVEGALGLFGAATPARFVLLLTPRP